MIFNPNQAPSWGGGRYPFDDGNIGGEFSSSYMNGGGVFGMVYRSIELPSNYALANPVPVKRNLAGKPFGIDDGVVQVEQNWVEVPGWRKAPKLEVVFNESAYLSAIRMLQEHDFRIADSGSLPMSGITPDFRALEEELIEASDKVQELRVAAAQAMGSNDLEAAENTNEELDSAIAKRIYIEKQFNGHTAAIGRKVNSDRKLLLAHYYMISLLQLDADYRAFEFNEQHHVFYSIDGIIAFNTDRLEREAFQRNMFAQIENDKRLLEEFIVAGRTERELVELSRLTATDPVSRAFVDSEIDKIIPPVVRSVPSLPGESTYPIQEIEWAPTQTLEGANNPALSILRNPSMPYGPGNILTPLELRQRELRIAQRLVDDAPEYYDLEWEKNLNPQKWRADYTYWRSNYPTITVKPEENSFLDPQLLLTPWDVATMGPAPIINMEVIPRTKPLPPLGFLAKYKWIGIVLQVLLALIPIIGIALSMAVGFMLNQAQAGQLKRWAEEVGEFPPTAFAPAFYPQVFTVPMPLDRAQLLAREPWFAPMMVDEAVKEYAKLEIAAVQSEYEARASVPVGDGAIAGLPAQSLTGLGGNLPVLAPTLPPSKVKSSNSLTGLILVGAAVGAWMILDRKKR